MLTNNYLKTKAKNERLLACVESFNLISKPVLAKIKGDYAYANKAFMAYDDILVLAENKLRDDLINAVGESLKPLHLLKRLQHKVALHLLLVKSA
ncbi:MAG: hypothetical protein LEGION0398_MBIBDBAK_00240 [Legionellaceae bacterium]